MIKCAICDSVLSEPYIPTSEFEVLKTCDKHKEYRKFINPIPIKINLGIDFDRNINCEICGVKLIDSEIDTINSVSDVSNTCMEHRLYSNVWQVSSVRGILGYEKNITGLTKEMLDEQCKNHKSNNGY